VFLAGVAAFAAALPNGWLGDDHVLLEQRLAAATWSSLPVYFSESYWGTLHAGGLYRPLTLVLLGAQRIVFGLDLTGYRVITLLVHGASGVLVLAILRGLAGSRGALVGALLFAVHPVHAEAVATVYGQQDVWAGVFFLAAILCHRAAWAHRTTAWAAASGVSFLLSLLCKEQGVFLPILLLLWGPRMSGASSARRSWTTRPEAWFAAALATYALLRLYVLGRSFVPGGDASVAFGYPWWARVNLIVTTLGTYVRLLVAPYGQTTYYGHLRNSIFGVPVTEFAILSATGFALWTLRRHGEGIATKAAIVLAVTLLPVANVVPIGAVVAERCLYLPVIAVSLFATAAWRRFAPVSPRITAVLAGALVLAGIVASAQVAHRWRTPLSHWESTAADHPDSPKAHAMIGLLLLQALVEDEGAPNRELQMRRAGVALTRALELNAGLPEAWHGWGLLHVLRGHCREAADALARGRALGSDDPGSAALYDRYCRS
jgi:hypothetical protein